MGLKPKLLLGGKEWQLATRAGYRDKETSPQSGTMECSSWPVTKGITKVTMIPAKPIN